MERFFRWVFGTRNGLITFAALIFAGILYFQPELLASVVRQVLGATINLVGMILTGILNGVAHVIQANQRSLEYLFCIAMLGFGIVLMFRFIFKRGGGKK